jgi:hypothetical protein
LCSTAEYSSGFFLAGLQHPALADSRLAFSATGSLLGSQLFLCERFSEQQSNRE